MQEPFDRNTDDLQPEEPDWESLLRALEEAEEWLRSENGLDEENFIIRIAAVGLACNMIEGTKSGAESDDIIRQFFDLVNRTAFFVAGQCSDESLGDWVQRFCVDPHVEWSRIEYIRERASCRGEA
jgi:hypothetical protein